MGEKTEKLVAACTSAVETCETALTTAENELTEFESFLKKLDRLGRDGDPDVGARLVNEALEQKGIVLHCLRQLEQAIAPVERATKDLGSKLKTKQFLSLFKTQRSLGEAKAVHTDAQTKAKNAKKKLELMNRRFAKLDDRLTAHFGQIAENREDRPYIEKVEEWEKRKLPTFAKTLSMILVVLKGRKAELAKLRARFDKTVGWDARERDALANEVRDVEAAVGAKGVQDQATKMFAALIKGLKDIDLPDRPSRAARAAFEKAEAATLKTMELVDDALQQALDLTADAGALLAELEEVPVGPDSLDNDARVLRARRSMERYLTMSEGITFERFRSAVENFGDWTPFLTRASKDPSSLDEKDWRRFDDMQREFVDEAFQLKGTWRTIQRTARQAEQVARRFGDDEKVAAMYKRFQAAMANLKKDHENYQKTAPLVQKHIKRIATFRP